jgi:hypothetical protein
MNREGDITSAHRNPDHNTWQSALDRFSTLGSLAFTCKDLQKAVAPLLYQSVMVSIEKPVAFIRLIRRFSRVPGDGHLVKELSILGGSGGPNLSSDQAAFLSREASHLGIRKQETGDSVKAASLLIDVLLCQVPSIQKLTICEPRIPYERVMPMGLDYAKRLPENFTLECLQHLETLPPGRAAMSRRHMASLAALLRHAPALTHLRVGRCDRSTDSVIEHPLPQLRELRVVDASLEVLKGVVRCCPGLQRVQLVEDTIDLSPMAAKFQAYHESLNPDKVAPGPLERALTSLLPLKATLRDVGIDWESFRTVKIQSLHPCPSLRLCSRCEYASRHGHLRIPAFSLPASQAGSNRCTWRGRAFPSTTLPCRFLSEFSTVNCRSSSPFHMHSSHNSALRHWVVRLRRRLSCFSRGPVWTARKLSIVRSRVPEHGHSEMIVSARWECRPREACAV